MNELRFSCPECSQHFLGPEDYVGQRIQCPSCATEFTLADPRSSTSLRLQAHLAIAPPGPGTHSAPVAPEAQARLDAAREAATKPLRKTARLTQFLGNLIRLRPPPGR